MADWKVACTRSQIYYMLKDCARENDWDGPIFDNDDWWYYIYVENGALYSAASNDGIACSEVSLERALDVLCKGPPPEIQIEVGTLKYVLGFNIDGSITIGLNTISKEKVEKIVETWRNMIE